MNEKSRELAKEIAETRPSVVVITGSIDPTYGSDTFFETLVMHTLSYQKLSIDLYANIQRTRQKTDDWILATVEKIHHDYEITKHTKDDLTAYVIGEFYEDDPPEFDEAYKRFNIDFGGVIILHYINI